MKIYSHDKIIQIEDRFASVSCTAKPLVHRIINEDNLERVRNEIETWVSELDVYENAQVISRLTKNDDHFIQTYHELAVGAFLNARDFEVKYESISIEDNRPDWFVTSLKTGQEFALEVVSINRSAEDVRSDIAQNDLLRRIEKISGEFCVGIDFDADTEISQRRNKETTYTIKGWLRSKPVAGEFIKIDNHRFDVALEQTGLKNVTYIASSDAFWVNPMRLAKKIKKKIGKYNEAVIRNRIPFVIAVISHPGNGYDLEMFEEVIRGFNEKSGLSAAIWCWKDANFEWRMKVIDNPNASLPLIDGLFPKDCFD